MTTVPHRLGFTVEAPTIKVGDEFWYVNDNPWSGSYGFHYIKITRILKRITLDSHTGEEVESHTYFTFEAEVNGKIETYRNEDFAQKCFKTRDLAVEQFLTGLKTEISVRQEEVTEAQEDLKKAQAELAKWEADLAQKTE